MFFTSTRYPNHYYCYLDNQVLLIDNKKQTVNVVKDDYTLEAINDYKDKKITSIDLLLELKCAVSNYLLNSIVEFNNKIIEYKELHDLISSF